MRFGVKFGVVDKGYRIVKVRAGGVPESTWEEAVRG